MRNKYKDCIGVKGKSGAPLILLSPIKPAKIRLLMHSCRFAHVDDLYLQYSNVFMCYPFTLIGLSNNIYSKKGLATTGPVLPPVL